MTTATRTLPRKLAPPRTAPIVFLDNPRSAIEVAVDPSLANSPGMYGLRELLRIIGLPSIASQTDEPSLYYGPSAQIGSRAAIWIEPQQINSPPLANFIASRLPLGKIADSHALWGNRRLTIDLPRAAAFWLTLENEHTVIQRDQHGRVRSGDSLLGQLGNLHQPPVHDYARVLADRLLKLAPSARLIPRWPHDKRYAVALTHDVDHPERPSPIEQIYNGRKSNRIRTWRQAYWQFRSDLRRRPLATLDPRPPTLRNEWDFSRFTQLERRCGLRSAFYFASTDKCHGSTWDVAYDCAAPRYTRLYRRLNQTGWEVGLHAGYLTATTPGRITEEFDRLSDITTKPLHGVRHHYLHVDDAHPLTTLEQLYQAGLQYDATLGFNDAPGFRAGIALPYLPVRDGCADAPFVELPMTIADMHLPTHDIAQACQTVLDHLTIVRNLDGLAVLNWHVGHWVSHPAWREAYRTACEMLANDDHAWVATPRQIAAWTLERSARLFDHQ